jgi:hypothetical protein
MGPEKSGLEHIKGPEVLGPGIKGPEVLGPGITGPERVWLCLV